MKSNLKIVPYLLTGILLLTFWVIYYSLFANKNPEILTLEETLKSKYPSRNFILSVSRHQTQTSLSLGFETHSANIRTVSISFETENLSSNDFSAEEMKNVAITASKVLADETSMLKVQATKTTSFLIIPINKYYYGFETSCNG